MDHGLRQRPGLTNSHSSRSDLGVTGLAVLPEFKVWQVRGRGDEGVRGGDVCLDVHDLKTDARLGLPARPGQQPLRPEAGEDLLLLLLVLLVAGEDPGAGPPGDHQELGQVHRAEVPDDLLHLVLAAVLGDDVAVLLLVLLVAAVSAVWKYKVRQELSRSPRPALPRLVADTGADLVMPASTVLSGLQSRDSPSSEEGMVARRLLGRTPLVSSPAHWSDSAASSHSRLVRSGWICQSAWLVREIFSILLSPQPISALS